MRRALAVACFVSLAAGASARSAPVRVLIAAPVAADARTTMAPDVWAKIVSNYVNAQALPFAGAVATLDDCHAAQADYVVNAPFELRSPGTPSTTGQTAARTHLVVTNCLTGSVVFDRTIEFESDKPSSASEGDFESAPEIVWNRSAPAALAKYSIPFTRVARVSRVTAPLAFVDVPGSLVQPGDVLSDFAGSDRRPHAPILLTVTLTHEKYVEVMFSTLPGVALPSVGDLVEPRAVAIPQPSPSS
ncbi:MAG TPA: hypothetical protein VKG44_01250 [Candidatus Baltobacteraceae bacterium]|nr:hypothetical protein [Candidatus Baltobacteraceae bacterium]